MTAILFYANYDNNSTSIIRTHFICPVTKETDDVSYRSNFTIQMAAILFMNTPVYYIIHM